MILFPGNKLKNMSEEVEYRCFVGGLSWSTSDRGLKDAFKKFGHLIEAKVIHLCIHESVLYVVIHDMLFNSPLIGVYFLVLLFCF